LPLIVPEELPIEAPSSRIRVESMPVELVSVPVTVATPFSASVPVPDTVTDAPEAIDRFVIDLFPVLILGKFDAEAGTSTFVEAIGRVAFAQLVVASHDELVTPTQAPVVPGVTTLLNAAEYFGPPEQLVLL
jgi:hypothetical protein